MTTEQKFYGFGYGEGGMRAATKSDACVISLLGGRSHSAGVTLTCDQWARLGRFYSYDLSPEGEPTPLPDPPKKPAPNAGYFERQEYDRAVRNWERDCAKHDPQALHRFALAGAERNLDRYVAADGVRLMALLSRFLEDGQDPVALVAQLLAEAGYDTQGAEFDSEPEEDEGEEAAAE
jgi:hypothetical protein